MTDREMLELAAKAAGIRTPSPDDMDLGGRQYEESLGLWCKFKWGWNWWNPLADDGDALRLAVKLGISLTPYPIYNSDARHSVIAKQRRRSDTLREANPTECMELYGSDIYAATRRAITRAAAEIGRQMEETT